MSPPQPPSTPDNFTSRGSLTHDTIRYSWLDRYTSMWVEQKRNTTKYQLVVDFQDEKTDYTFLYNTEQEAVEEKARMLAELKLWREAQGVEVGKRWLEMERKLDMLWNAPGGPGAVEAQTAFEEKVGRFGAGSRERRMNLSC